VTHRVIAVARGCGANGRELSTTLTDVLGDDAWRERALGLIFDPQATSGYRLPTMRSSTGPRPFSRPRITLLTYDTGQSTRARNAGLRTKKADPHRKRRAHRCCHASWQRQSLTCPSCKPLLTETASELIT
jgi:hypothetical protein